MAETGFQSTLRGAQIEFFAHSSSSSSSFRPARGEEARLWAALQLRLHCRTAATLHCCNARTLPLSSNAPDTLRLTSAPHSQAQRHSSAELAASLCLRSAGRAWRICPPRTRQGPARSFGPARRAAPQPTRQSAAAAARGLPLWLCSSASKFQVLPSEFSPRNWPASKGDWPVGGRRASRTGRAARKATCALGRQSRFQLTQICCSRSFAFVLQNGLDCVASGVLRGCSSLCLAPLVCSSSFNAFVWPLGREGARRANWPAHLHCSALVCAASPLHSAAHCALCTVRRSLSTVHSPPNAKPPTTHSTRRPVSLLRRPRADIWPRGITTRSLHSSASCPLPPTLCFLPSGSPGTRPPLRLACGATRQPLSSLQPPPQPPAWPPVSPLVCS